MNDEALAVQMLREQRQMLLQAADDMKDIKESLGRIEAAMVAIVATLRRDRKEPS